jgi:hypothetical protein
VGRLTDKGLQALLNKPGRHSDGAGLYFRVVRPGLGYWAFRFRSGGREREMSLGPYPEVSLSKAHERHAAARATVVVDKADQMADVAAQLLDLPVLLALQFRQPDLVRFLLALQSTIEPMTEQPLAQKAPSGQ